MYKVGFDPGQSNSAIAVFKHGILHFCEKLRPIDDVKDLRAFYQDLAYVCNLCETPCNWNIERFSSRGSASKISEVINITIGMAVSLCVVNGYSYNLYTASSWKRKVKPEYTKGQDPHMLDAKYLALL